ncbi:UDP-N-acetylmuramoyl-tripeptide--D-alanyl-D-alanine ligase [Pseudomonas alliivorans]|uniref:UDP-N-acetylmuramoyl-tripeptide--D-alanyl-D-alanine ligase n=1 Tax=Pseudomonas alliivorans TaxID=2810613 RepID=A0ABS4C6X2_9PSED|nr:UDP-N-acetylmuramoyl-tripeptide--D-alanyl-D-alanine ligase [Pseudomonas alliivorans]MBP0946346.1 UDP-N-acetylmuramoyl-tripeptide--D-alanyl-D-alanine ligase [Pseudomonas alliivorans]MEE4327959.1 UDP-N-acetylmuramoyl-tripeptide--D-alanyl-D-alanine ligase [Pseudomonas alliivorans]MEE4335879.1 UDP-N-acetylmuramoyl-tripeptide--D-alanyl-D-alanine ligase [Pseudomonas alliivorans]MEE4369377.1 UDP-N-acetylmuramoyl-tripeptide--D-alanyl-D-alanine ligase [Pseudomonas alliivorans]MEE4679523.1 UDP-N-acet
MFKPLTFSELVAPLNARLAGRDCSFDGVSTDSRAIVPGQLFIALTGPRFDGHEYLDQVAAKGAVGALVESEVPGSNLPQLVVLDTRKALAQLGAMNRNAFVDRPVAAVTGSSGKTTVKEMLASILRTRGSVLATRGNLNNELGVPLTLLELGAEHAAAVIELGASRVGEIAFTVSLTKPHVVILTNAGTAHVGEFGGPDRIVEAKGEIIEGLDAKGTAVLNLDDKAFPIWRLRAGDRKVLTFALSNVDADLHASELHRDERGCPGFMLHSPSGSAQVQLNLLGTHNVTNALAAAAAACALGVSLDGIVEGLNNVQPVKGRAVPHIASNGMRVIDDTYNANPSSVNAAVDLLTSFPGRTVLVLGDIGELGEWAEQGHHDVGAYAKDKVSALYAVGPLMTHAVSAFGPHARHFITQAELIEALGAEQDKNTTLLIKGSRSAAMENVVAALCGSSLEKH